MGAPTRREEIQFLLRAGEVRCAAASSGDETQAATALATLRLAIAAERIADVLEARGATHESQGQPEGPQEASGRPVAADAGETPAELHAALRWAAQSLGQQDPKDHINRLLIMSEDWAIPCRPTSFDCGGGWQIIQFCDTWGYYNTHWLDGRSTPFPTPRAAWNALQRDPRYSC